MCALKAIDIAITYSEIYDMYGTATMLPNKFSFIVKIIELIKYCGHQADSLSKDSPSLKILVGAEANKVGPSYRK